MLRVIPRFPHTVAGRYRSSGLWGGRTIDEVWQQAQRTHSGSTALVDADREVGYAELAAAVDAIAVGLRVRGVGRGDVVSLLLPTWWEAAAIVLAAQRVGAVVNPLHLTYREREIAFIAAQTGTRVVFTCESHGRTGYRELLTGAVAALADPPEIVSVRSADDTWADWLSAGDPLPPNSDACADDIALIVYTSGTTSDPKGVLHSHNTLLRCVRDMDTVYELTADDRVFVPSPITHVAGLMFVLAVLLGGGTAVLLDTWDDERALDLVLREKCTFAGGALTFIRGLIDAAQRRGLPADRIPITRGNCGAADVPADLIAVADRVLGATYSRGYGLTEGIVISVCGQRESFEHRARTDGRIVPDAQVRVVDEWGRDVPPGEAGEVLVRGPQNFLGYLDATANTEAFADGDWFRTGDLGRLVDGEYVTIVGRLKEMISRGGENIAAREIEELLADCPGVADVALVGLPHPRLGEFACAVVVPESGAQVTLDTLTAHLRGRGVAPQKWPERCVVRDQPMPRTVSGKTRKADLRAELLAALPEPHLTEHRDGS